ncbi:hypothetical protein CEXT_406011 [Caerostris extrusa]|uniref:Uncharacterized protein n=1 Tax=Caerostris extrusa TaxID=172846 RepID=A0AAV4NQL0_CAEEX|nr:hypothetical protein CEXT_406011 [Caerostris extrusa]
MPQGFMPRTAHINIGGKEKGKVSQQSPNPDFSNQSSKGTWNRGKRNLIYGKSFCESRGLKSPSFHTHKGKAHNGIPKPQRTLLTEKTTTKPMPQGLMPRTAHIEIGGKGKEKCHNNPKIQILVTNHQTGHGTEEKKSYLRKKLFANLEDSKSLSFHTHKGKAL